jgi:integrase/recombinase XerD
MSDPWPSFAFSPDSDWGTCYLSFLRAAYEHSGSKSTYAHYKQTLAHFFTTEPAKLPDRYTRADVETFIHGPQRRGKAGGNPSPGTINSRLSILNSFYSYAAVYGVPDRDTGMLTPLMRTMAPTAGLKQLQRAIPPRRDLTSEELHRFFAAIDTSTALGARDYALFLCYFFTARRLGEIRRLTWGDIREEMIVEGGERRLGYVYAFTGKGHSRQSDSAEMPVVCYQAILDYLDKSGKRANIQASDPIFTTVPGTVGQHHYDAQRMMSPQTIWATCKRIAKRAGLDPKNVTVHSFRHSSSRMRYEAGEDIRSISELLRHSNIAITYAYLRQETTVADSGFKLIQAKFEDL